MMKTTQKTLLAIVAGSIFAVTSSPATVLVSEPFDYPAQTYAAGTWSSGGASNPGGVLSGSGVGWGTNGYFDHATSAANFVIGGGGPAGTYFESAGQNYTGSTYWRNRVMSPAIGNGTDGTVIWHSMLVWSDGTDGGGIKVHNSNGGTQYNLRIAPGNVYELVGGHGGEDQDLSSIPVSADINTPDLLVFRIENAGGAGMQTTSLWVNPSSTTEGGLPAADLSVSYPVFAGNRNIGGINIAPGAIKLDELVFAEDYADLGIGVVVTGPVIVVRDGIASLSDGASTVDFGSSVIGVAVEKTLTITNDGTADLTLGAITMDGPDAADFAVGAPGADVLAVGESTTFTVTFTPAVYGAGAAAIHLASDSSGDLDPFDLALSGIGLPPISVRQGSSTLTDGSSTVNFGSSLVGAPVSRIFTISNGGLTDLTLGAITKEGLDQADFVVGALGTSILAPGSSTTFTVTFRPTVELAESATIHIANDAPGDVNSFAIGLTGSGHAPGATIVVTEPFDYNVGVFTQTGANPDNNWTATMGSGSGTGWGGNEWFSHIGSDLQFGIGTGGHTGTFADSTGLNYPTNTWRQRIMSPTVHSNSDGAVTWQHLNVSVTGPGTAGLLVTQNSNGGFHFAVRVMEDGTYALSAEHSNAMTQTSSIAASTDATTPDTVVVKMENQVDGASNLFDVSMWVNPIARSEAGLPAPDLQIPGASPFAGNRNIGGVNWMPGTTQIDNFVLAGDYADFKVGGAPGGIVITSITSMGGGIWELTLVGAAETGYEFRSSPVVDFNPGTLVENLAPGDPGDPGSIGGTNDSLLTTDSNGDATVRMALGGLANFVVAQLPPPLLSEGFETTGGGFTMVDHSGGTGTLWVLGDPDSDGEGGAVSTGNGGSARCWGTDISNPGTYLSGTDTSLISPVINLTGLAGATLSFAQAIDILEGDTLVVNVVDDATGTVLEPAIHTSTPDRDINAADWTTISSVAITGGQPVRIEWRFTGNGDGTYLGAYIDDVVVTAVP
jgi:hypothetical protein